MELYKISPDDENWGKVYNDDLVAYYPWHLPGVHCPECDQKWAEVGLSYPLVDLSKSPLGKQLKKARNAKLDVFEMLQDAAKQYVPIGLPLLPGTAFGPLKGKIKGRFGDFVWRQSWDLLIRVEVYQKLAAAELHLPEPVVPILQEKVQGQLFHLQIQAHGYLSHRSYVDPDTTICPRCKRDTRKIKKIIMMKESLPTHLDVFRIGDFPTKILVTERFKDAVDQLGLTNILFEKVELE